MKEPYMGVWPEIHPEAFVHSTSVVIGRVRIGAESTLWPNTTLRGDDGEIVIGERTSIQDNTVIHMTEDLSSTQIGDQVTVGHGVILHGCTVENNVIVGMGSTLLDNSRIGAFSIVGANSLVTQGKEFPPYSMIMGSPAKVIRPLNERELEWIAYSWKRYVEQGRRYRGVGE